MRTVALALLLALGGCADSTGTVSVDGTFALESIQGPIQTQVQDGRMTLGDGVYTLTYTARTDFDPPTSVAETGTYTARSEANIRFVSDSGVSFHGAIADGELTFQHAGYTFRWRRE